MSKPTVVYFGASRGVAYAGFKALAALRPDIHHVLMIRSVSRFEASEEYKSLPEDLLSRTTIIPGDAHNVENVRDALKAGGDNMIAIVSSIGWRPPMTFTKTVVGVVKGMTPDPPDICCRALTILLIELERIYPSLTIKPKFVLCSSMGMGRKAHAALAFGLGTSYRLFADKMHDDKICMELVLAKLLVPSTPPKPTFFPDRDEAPSHLLPAATYDSLPPPFLPQDDVCVLRPAVLSEGPRKGWIALAPESKGKKATGYRVMQEGPGKEESKGKRLYSVSREDVGDFMGILLAGEESKAQMWWGRQPAIGY